MAVLRFLLHFISLLALVAAIVAGTLDAIQSVSSSDVVMTSLGNAWLNFDPEGLTLAEMSADTYIGTDIWRPYVAPMLAQPAFAIFLVLALVFWIAGYSRPRSERFLA
ncbi:hypothetical protein FHW37_104185 [Neorhizobium alkalisoli]|jgi:hypothetical protein|uniref:Uncharacterized protein n=1 Tax=Neorhizobium alkalisoli TaxID=528178 RepID=A0A561QRL1_9HYPH|nr:hypothetical protein [Neorhizobium alkalisoli]TWF52916.1 hypothetical protein FHW37_104185 [Neorhizobium alkalisoli]